MRTQKGFTLIEMMVSMALFSILLMVAVGIFLDMLRTQTQASVVNNIQQEGRISIELFARIAKEAQTVVVNDGSVCDGVAFYLKDVTLPITFGCSGSFFQMDNARITTTDVRVSGFQVIFPVSERDMKGSAGSSNIISYPKSLSYTLTLAPSGTNKLINDLVFKGSISMRTAI